MGEVTDPLTHLESPPKNMEQVVALFFREQLKPHYGKQLVLDLIHSLERFLSSSWGFNKGTFPSQESCGRALLPLSQSWEKSWTWRSWTHPSLCLPKNLWKTLVIRG